MSGDEKGIGLVVIIVGLVMMALIGVGGYFLGSKNIFNSSPVPTLSPSPSLLATPSPTPTPTPIPQISASPSAVPVKPELLETIKSAISTKNTAALEGYMSDSVNVIVEATECCGNITKVKAIQELDYLNTATLPWNFDDDNPIAIALRQKNPMAFPPGVIIGTSANRRLVTFTLNQDKTKIIKLYMAVDYKLHGI